MFYDDCEVGETILKPLSGTGSEGIVKISGKEDIDSAWSWIGDGTGDLLVEEFVGGSEYSAEGVFVNGKHKLLAITKNIQQGIRTLLKLLIYSHIIYPKNIIKRLNYM